jgi:hypothetical protein
MLRPSLGASIDKGGGGSRSLSLLVLAAAKEPSSSPVDVAPVVHAASFAAFAESSAAVGVVVAAEAAAEEFVSPIKPRRISRTLSVSLGLRIQMQGLHSRAATSFPVFKNLSPWAKKKAKA